MSQITERIAADAKAYGEANYFGFPNQSDGKDDYQAGAIAERQKVIDEAIVQLKEYDHTSLLRPKNVEELLNSLRP